MNKAVIVALLFCVTSFTGCIGGDNSTDLEVLKEEEQIEPVGTDDLTNISADLESLESELSTFLQNFETLQDDLEQLHMSHNSLENSSKEDAILLSNRLESLEAELHHLEEYLDNFTVDVHHNFDNFSAEVNELHEHLDDITNHMEQMQNQMNNLTLMHLMDENQRHVFNKMLLIQHLKENDAINMNLSEVDLSGADLSGVNFAGADLSHANLDGARFVGNNFSHAKLDQSHANGAYFRLVHFDRASVQNAFWNAVEIRDSVLGPTKFIGTEMHNCIISDSDLTHSDFSKVKANDCQFEFLDAAHSVWSSASLDHSTLMSSNFDETDFSSSSNEQTSLVGVTYQGMSFRDSKFTYADMSHSTMTGGMMFGDDDRYIQKLETYYCPYDDDGNWDSECGVADLEFSYDTDGVQLYDHHYSFVSCVDFFNADMNNTILNDSDICSGWAAANFENAQFRRADMTNTDFGVISSPGHSLSNESSGCYNGCMMFKNTAFSLADLSGSNFMSAVFFDADFGGSSVGNVDWSNAMWKDTVWTNGDTINGRGNPSNWD
ncbi:pentapeptide repeat-containing protein [Marine Group III euryarchaeote]|nr:pentapeptide repeat-containing protein [Marine Group III euryarchaeote]